MLYFARSGVKRVHVVLFGLRMRFFVLVHVCISCWWMFSFAMFMSLCVDVMMMFSALVVSFTGACGVGVSDVYMLKSVGNSTPPCGTPFLNWFCGDFVSECGVCFAAFDVFDNGVWDVCLV